MKDKERRLLMGRWATTKIELRAEEKLSARGQSLLQESQESQRRVEKEIRTRKLAMIHAFYDDSTYDYIVLRQGLESRYPSYHEVGTWALDPTMRLLTTKATNQEVSSLPEATILRVDANLLIVEMRFSGNSKGIVETIFHRRVKELG